VCASLNGFILSEYSSLQVMFRACFEADRRPALEQVVGGIW